mgnify:CR=1 FL=1
MNKKNIFTIFLVSIFTCYIIYAIQAYLYRESWKKETSPLPKETVLTLCERLSLSTSHHLCRGTEDVYASDFSEALREYFHLKDTHRIPKNEATTTYQDVETVLGEFKWECQDVEHFPSSGYSSFRCFYDLRGDRYWRDVFYFYFPEETLYSIRSGTARDD